MQLAIAYTGLVARNIPFEMAQLALELGEGLTRTDLKRHGYTDKEIDRCWPQAAAIFLRQSTYRAR
jgi:hypothetical protein